MARSLAISALVAVLLLAGSLVAEAKIIHGGGGDPQGRNPKVDLDTKKKPKKRSTDSKCGSWKVGTVTGEAGGGRGARQGVARASKAARMHAAPPNAGSGLSLRPPRGPRPPPPSAPRRSELGERDRLGMAPGAAAPGCSHAHPPPPTHHPARLRHSRLLDRWL